MADKAQAQSPEDVLAGKWAALSAPFPADMIEKLPKQVRRDDRERGKCVQGSRGVSMDGHYCGGFHALAIHLDYIGHAGVTQRLNEVDPTWTWEPLATHENGLPVYSDGGLWIKLTVLGVTRLGFGDAGGKTGPNATKEIIGDALRNSALRFGVATYLWSKSEAAEALKQRGTEQYQPEPEPTYQQQQQRQVAPPASAADIVAWAHNAVTIEHAKELWRRAEQVGILDKETPEGVPVREFLTRLADGIRNPGPTPFDDPARVEEEAGAELPAGDRPGGEPVSE